jgi:hypothetical protein
MLILANQFRVGSKLGNRAKSSVLGLRAEYLTISNIFRRVTTGKIETIDMLRNPYQKI